MTIELPPTDPPETELTIRFDGAICRTLHIGLMGATSSRGTQSFGAAEMAKRATQFRMR